VLNRPSVFVIGSERKTLIFLRERTATMLSEGTRVKMTKGYRGAEGTIVLKTDSEFELYVISLDNGLRIVAGPSSFDLSTAKQ
jgi:hypothetical protein